MRMGRWLLRLVRIGDIRNIKVVVFSSVESSVG